MTIMVESINTKGFQGRSVFNHVVHVESATPYTPGDLIDVTIFHAGQHSLQGRII